MCVNSPQAPRTPLQCSIVPVTSHCCPSEQTFITFLAFAALSVAQPCPFRKSYPDVLVVQSSQDRNGDNGARALDCSMQGRIFL